MEKILSNIKGGTAQGGANAKQFSKFRISIPNLSIQEKIVSILSSLDSKIEINNKIISNLEEQAQLLFKHWFVDFEFPNEHGQPYKSSGGEMVESELGMIPKGWIIKELNSLIKKNSTKIKNKADWQNEKLIDLANMPSFSTNLSSYEYGNKLNSNIYKLEKFDILFGSIRPYLGKALFSPFDGVTTGTIHSLKPIQKEYFSFVLETMLSRSFFDFAIKRSKGTKMPVVNWDDLVSYPIITPEDESILCKFNKIVFDFLNKQQILMNENYLLSETRDLLLPKLMSGEINVENLDL